MRQTIRFASKWAAIGMLMGLPLAAHAQDNPPPPIQMSFAIPTGVDPAKLYLTTPGQSYTSTNDPNSNSNGPINGATLLGTAFGGLGGLEIHENFPGAQPISLDEFDFAIPYTGALTLSATSDPDILDPQTQLPYLPWLATDEGIHNNLHLFKLTPQIGSAPLDESDYYGVLSATVPNGVDDTAFLAATFSADGMMTPEPGAAALALGAVLAGGLLAKRRRKPGKSGSTFLQVGS